MGRARRVRKGTTGRAPSPPPRDSSASRRGNNVRLGREAGGGAAAELAALVAQPVDPLGVGGADEGVGVAGAAAGGELPRAVRRRQVEPGGGRLGGEGGGGEGA